MLAVDPGGRLLMYRGTGAGAFAPGGGLPIGTGWGSFTALLAPGDWSGDGKPDLLARDPEGVLLMYRGNGRGGFITGQREQIGSGWQRSPRCSPCATGTATAGPTCSPATPPAPCSCTAATAAAASSPASASRSAPAGSSFTALLAPGDWSGDGKPDLLARDADGLLFMYRGNGRGGFVTGQREQIGSGWQGFTALFGGGDFSGDGRQDLVARDANGLLFMYRGNGRGGFVTGQREQIGSGWSSLSALTLVWDPIPPPRTPRAPRAAEPPRSRTAARGSRSPRLHPPGRPPQGPRAHPPPRRAHAATRVVRRLLRPRRARSGWTTGGRSWCGCG